MAAAGAALAWSDANHYVTSQSLFCYCCCAPSFPPSLRCEPGLLFCSLSDKKTPRSLTKQPGGLLLSTPIAAGTVRSRLLLSPSCVPAFLGFPSLVPWFFSLLSLVLPLAFISSSPGSPLPILLLNILFLLQFLVSSPLLACLAVRCLFLNQVTTFSFQLCCCCWDSLLCSSQLFPSLTKESLAHSKITLMCHPREL